MTVTPQQVLLYVPNLIGYGRIILTGSAVILMIAFRQHWLAAISMYMASFVGDLFGTWA